MREPRAKASRGADPAGATSAAGEPSWEHFAHDADIGVRGRGATPAEAFAQAALAMTAVVTDLKAVRPAEAVAIACKAPSLDLLFYRWLNAVVFEMATRRAVFGAFDVAIEGSHLTAVARGETVDRERHAPAVEVKGATLTEDLPEALKPWGQPVLIGGSMGMQSFVLAGASTSEARAFSSACHGAGRQMSRHQALKTRMGRQVVDELKATRHHRVRSPSSRGVAEEAPGAYKDVGAVVDAAEAAGLARKVARLQPMICIKG